jgi:hypothetical protein
MQAEHQVGSHSRTTRREVGGVPEAPNEMLALPRWESFPLEDRHRLVRTILQAARHQVEARQTSSHPRR